MKVAHPLGPYLLALCVVNSSSEKARNFAGRRRYEFDFKTLPILQFLQKLGGREQAKPGGVWTVGTKEIAAWLFAFVKFGNGVWVTDECHRLAIQVVIEKQ